MKTPKSIARKYYESWARQDKKNVVQYLSNDHFTFSSPQESFSNAKEFVDVCWFYSEGLESVKIIKKVNGGIQLFLILLW